MTNSDGSPALATGATRAVLALLPLLLVLPACAPAPESETEATLEIEPTLKVDLEPVEFVARVQASQTTSRLQAVSAVDTSVIWASGLDGAYAFTHDGGDTWQAKHGLGIPDTEALQFRDVHAFDHNLAFLLSAGPGDVSRIYKTTDGGATWQLQFVNLDPEGFLNCFDFWDPHHGIAYGDSVRGELFVLTTSDGSTWSRVPADALPPAGDGEGGFAASGTCVETGENGKAWIATGAGGNARVLLTSDYGETWSFADTPTVKGATAGLMSVRFRSDLDGVALGGDLDQPDTVTANVAFSGDGGASWAAGGTLPFAGAVYGGAWGGGVLIAAGPGGISSSLDSGRTWHSVSDSDTWAVDFGDDDTFWAVGPEGRITRFDRKR